MPGKDSRGSRVGKERTEQSVAFLFPVKVSRHDGRSISIKDMSSNREADHPAPVVVQVCRGGTVLLRIRSREAAISQLEAGDDSIKNRILSNNLSRDQVLRDQQTGRSRREAGELVRLHLLPSSLELRPAFPAQRNSHRSRSCRLQVEAT